MRFLHGHPPRLAAITVLCSLSASPVLAQDAIVFRGDAAHTGVYADPGPVAGPRVAWRYQADGAVRSTPAVTRGTVFVGTSAGTLVALDRRDGAVRWRYDAGSPLPSSPAVAGGLVLVAARDGSIHAVAARTGEGVWATSPTDELPLPWGREGWDYWVSSPTVADDLALVGLPDGRLIALDLASGALRWSHPLGARTRSSAAVANGRVYLGDDAGVVHAVALGDGQALWRHETEGAGLSSAEYGWDRTSIRASPAAADGVVYIGSRDGGVYALDAATGERLWYADHGAPWVVASAAVRSDTVWVGSSDGLFVAALDGATGRELWRTDVGARVFASPALAGGTLYVADHDGRVRALDAASGAERWRFAVGSGPMIQSSPVPFGRALYLGADDGSVIALAPGPAPTRLAVFWDSAHAGQAFRARNGRMLRDYLADYGYSVLDADRLEDWLVARIEDGASSAVVFATDVLPDGVVQEAGAIAIEEGTPAPASASGNAEARPDGGPLLRYLQAGGKVVWLGFPPGALVRDTAGRPVAIDHDNTTALFGLDASRSAQGQYPAAPTELGRTWGLEGFQLAETAVRPGDHVRALAFDELGRAAAVVRDFGGPPGSGLVLLWGLGADWDRLDEIRAATEYGVLRSP